MSSRADRYSNMELARIIAMAMIVFGHFIFHGIQGTIGPSPDVTPYLDWRECLVLSMSVLCCAGVDIFMLISGYFGIKLRWKSILSFYFLCLFYNGLSLAVSALSQPVALTDIFDIFFISRTGNWFFRCYFWVLLASPVLNVALRSFDIKALRLVIASGLVLVCVSSWRFANPDGNTALLLMYVYLLGGYLRREQLETKLSKKELAIGFLIVSFVAVLIGVVTYDIFHKEYGIFYQHNSILVLSQAVLLFLLFRKMKIKSRFVNSWASTVVAALFIQDVVLYKPLYGFVRDAYLRNGLSVRIIALILILTLAVFLASYIIERPRKIVADRLSGRLSVFLNKIINIGSLFGHE